MIKVDRATLVTWTMEIRQGLENYNDSIKKLNDIKTQVSHSDMQDSDPAKMFEEAYEKVKPFIESFVPGKFDEVIEFLMKMTNKFDDLEDNLKAGTTFEGR